MVAAAVAAGVAVAATAASTALSATQGGPDLPGYSGPSGLESRINRRNRDALFQSQDYAQRGAFEQNMITPDIYRQAGYEVEYDQGSMAAAADARAAADAASQRFDAARAGLDAMVRKGKGRAKKKDLKAAKRELRLSRRALDAATMAAGNRESQSGRIKSLKYKGIGSEADNEIDRLLTGRVTSALTTGQSDDPRLNRELAESEGTIRARLQRQFGPDYENTTAGAMALNAFRQRKAESLADFARKDISEYNPLRLSQRQTLGQIAAQNIGLMQAGPGARFSNATQLQNLGTAFQNFNAGLREDRMAAMGVERENAMAEYQADVNRTQAIAGGLNSLASAAGGYAGSGALSGARGATTMGAAAGAGDFVGPVRPRSLRGDIADVGRGVYDAGASAGRYIFG